MRRCRFARKHQQRGFRFDLILVHRKMPATRCQNPGKPSGPTFIEVPDYPDKSGNDACSYHPTGGGKRLRGDACQPASFGTAIPATKPDPNCPGAVKPRNKRAMMSQVPVFDRSCLASAAIRRDHVPWLRLEI